MALTLSKTHFLTLDLFTTKNGKKKMYIQIPGLSFKTWRKVAKKIWPPCYNLLNI